MTTGSMSQKEDLFTLKVTNTNKKKKDIKESLRQNGYITAEA